MDEATYVKRMEEARIRRQEEFKKAYEIALGASFKEAHIVDYPTDHPLTFTITTISSGPQYGGTRTPVVCSSFERAQEYVLENAMDMWEHSYMFAVITAIPLDYFYPTMISRANGVDYVLDYWFKWDLEEGRYRPVDLIEGIGGCPIG